MPEILVITRGNEGVDPAILLRERVTMSDFESDHFCGQLVERVGWAVVDADELERPPGAEVRPLTPRRGPLRRAA
jgi:hypothetical protein